MKALLASTALSAMLLSAPALAADFMEPAIEVLPPAAVAFDWSGPYVGIQGGYEWGDEEDGFDDTFGPFADTKAAAEAFDVDGFIAGGHAGYNWQSGRFVFGVEGEVDYSDLEGEADFEKSSFGDGTSEIIEGTLSVDTDWEASLRLRGGYAFDRFLLYVTAGGAFADVNVEVDGEVTSTSGQTTFIDPFGESWDDTFIGWTAGIGGEYAVTDYLLARIEFRYTDFGDEDFDTEDPPTRFILRDEVEVEDDDSFDVDLDTFSVRGGISYKF